jgi:chorismate mutase/prephenate dehydratase
VARLDELRRDIDAIDEEILKLLERRARAAEHVAEAKRSAGLASYYDPERERAVLDRLASRGADPFPRGAIRSVWREIMSGCLSVEEPVTVAFLGPAGTFSHVAARNLFGLAARYREATSIDGVFDMVRRGDALSGVVPVESSIEGSVTHTLDALVDGDLLIRQEFVLEVSYCLLSRAPGLTAVERVYAAPHALSHCRLWLAKHLPAAQIVQTSGATVATREAVADERAAAVGTRLTAELSGLSVLGDRIQDRSESATRYVVLAREDAPRTGRDKTTLAFSLPDAAARGALRRVLEIFDGHGINLSRIESRPRGKAWEYLFLVDVEGHRSDAAIASVIGQLRARCEIVKVLGSYPQHADRTT